MRGDSRIELHPLYKECVFTVSGMNSIRVSSQNLLHPSPFFNVHAAHRCQGFGTPVLVRRPKETLNSQNEHTVILLLLVDEEIRSYMLSLCREHKLKYLVVVDPEELVKTIKRLDSVIAFVDYEAVKAFGAKVYSRVNVACPGCNIILLSDQEHKSLVKEAMELGAYACILAPYEEWEVLTMIRNILTKRKLRKQKKPVKTQEL